MVTGWQGWVALAAGSGISAGIANQLITWLRDHLQRKFQRDQYLLEVEKQRLILLDQRRHEARLRAEQAHYEARATHLPHARNVHAWLYNEWAVRFGREVAYTSIVASPVTLQGPAEVLAELSEIAIGHPTRDVRELARDLDSRVDTAYNVQAANETGKPSRDELETWISTANRLIEAIHEPPGRTGDSIEANELESTKRTG